MILRDLIALFDRPLATGNLDVEVSAVTSDSRLVGPGTVFVAVRGESRDGRMFIPTALENGAVAIVADSASETGHPEEVAYVHVNDTRRALAVAAAAVAGEPSKKLKLVGVTGTNGKTTTAFLIHHLMKRSWHRAGLLGTVLVDDGEEATPANFTTPGPVELNGFLARMADHGCRGAAMEVSSHGIDQLRVHGIAFDAAIFSNLTQDHLDYHGTLDAYAATKFSWFESLAADPLGKKPVAVINTDDGYGEKLVALLGDKLPMIRYGFNVHCDFRANNFKQSARGMEFELTAKGKSYLVRSPLIGRFNVYNTLAALAGASAVKVPLREAVAAMAEAPQVPGRMEHCGTRDGVSVFVDYAHTPDALENACRTLKELNPSRLITVFGCGGDRDRGKRPLMGHAAATYSDACILTSDNPRSEDPEAILKEIEAGMGSARYRSVVDRAEAIRIAIHAAGKGDIVLIAGKGHEPYQQFADRTIDFDDRREARRALAERPEEPRKR
ncbi:UDP-N-acetylmuramoyl-L-alanyl-D-glutamate--2,6-diaminopimelate ligase [Luteolibacter sp. GHJ8]|uniref:UDP-N-acetylmuramoyl-L-alanyl-D-glutamate--2,6-diaminopimelate ligase n=1 Tax=Luteolibacter rhizosphaerae TaxID=2989719 RepID=A0ABT3G3U4_9BACT|nr:UDP-N-acetylmuramoyl-L-alanyl-D-glutamate--2,6-diaminopimelate ligase [Luteolibacter rhizosphaerae]MCW1914517.1 UDP-N-acetylmuramoyl-L-alanyl-D-glutamate--2,6-diaminopimelate ligase [Luteolibacter rhizosphaerae]